MSIAASPAIGSFIGRIPEAEPEDSGAARRSRRDLRQSSAQPTGCSPSSSTLPVGAARSRRTFVRFVASWRAAGKLRARATVFLHFRRNMNTDRDICTEERGSLREGVAALDAKRSRVFAEDDGWRAD